MDITDELIETLLWEEEGDTIDFKKDQYRFIDCTRHEKSELLKDILAFSNAWRRTDAYILIGVEDFKGGESIVKGIEETFDDSQIQQFINNKTQRPVQFSYRTLPFRNKKIAVIHIPVQERPIYLLKDYGKLKKNVVYIRRGSSTDEASPDEITRMGVDVSEQPTILLPDLQLRFRDAEDKYPEPFLIPSYKILNKSDVLKTWKIFVYQKKISRL